MDYIQHTLYINLLHREDRKIHVENELNKIGIVNAERFNAVKLTNGALGCSMSHLRCIQYAKQNGWDNVLVVEDDITFLDPELFKSQLKLFLEWHDDNWDMLLISGNNMLPYVHKDASCIKILNCLTTTGYLVKKDYYDTLIENYKEGIEKLLKEPTNKSYTIDRYWMELQRKHNWYLLVPLSVIQREDYSDIEKRVTNFKNYMLNYNKIVSPTK
jgi:glycosyl transferase, family 25